MAPKNVNIILTAFLIVSFLFQSCSDDSALLDVGSNVRNTNFSASETFSQNVAINNQSKLVLNGINGSIKIGITDGVLVTISGIRKVESESVADAQNYLTNLNVSIEDRGNEVFVQTQQPGQNFGRNLTVDYNISIPKEWIANIININGEVSVDSLEGDLLINLENGPVSLNSIIASVTIDVVNGNIDGGISLPIDGTIDLALVNGSINLNIPKTTSAAFSAKVTNGSINIIDLVLQNIQSSNTLVSGTLSSGQGTINLETVNGAINVTGF